MSPVYLKTRVGKTGRRYLVYYRRGGRSFPEEYAGSFKTQKEARARRDLIAGELAAGRDPRLILDALRRPAAPAAGLEQAWQTFERARIDVGAATRKLYGNSRRRIVPLIGADTDPHTITAATVQETIAGLAGLDPNTVRQYVSTLAQVLDHADVHPNPVRSPKVRLPSKDEPELTPPSTAEWVAARDKLARHHLLAARLVECDALRIGEALKLTYGDIDFASGRIRISRARTKTRSGQRWLPVPAELLDEIADLVPLEDRTADRRVFPTVEYHTFRNDLERACRLAGVAYFTPHALRHRRVSLWFAHGVDAIQVRAWAGHAKASMSTDLYGHVVMDAGADEWRQFWLAARTGRDPGAAPVRHRSDRG